MLTDYKKIFEKVEQDIKEYGYVIFNRDYKAHHINNYSFNLEISYNKNFSENINIIVKNRSGSILRNSTVNINDLEWLKNEIQKEY